MTISIAIIDKKNALFGCAGFTHWHCLGAINYTMNESGIILSQGSYSYAYLEGGSLLLDKLSPEEIHKKVAKEDMSYKTRQVGIINKNLESYCFTGEDCIDFANHTKGDDFIILGNLLSNKDVIKNSLSALKDDQSIDKRLLSALKVALRSGGEIRGIESSYLCVKKLTNEQLTTLIDARVDLDSDPLAKLETLVNRINDYNELEDILSQKENLENKDYIEILKNYLKRPHANEAYFWLSKSVMEIALLLPIDL
ncbi:DUF1028 domain-containing protein [Bacteriovoracaceae bacterium]|nr:DUF1028 domain-containing protein [Bacteriovoracaceae bacterium]